MVRRNKPSRRSRVALFAVLSAIVGLVVAVPGSAQAANATIIVTNLDDSLPGSLRAAIIQANADPGADVIEFNSTALDDFGTAPYAITLTTGFNGIQVLPPITQPLTIDATTIPGWSASTAPLVDIVSGGGFGGAAVFTVNAADVTIEGLAIAGDPGNGFGYGVDLQAGAVNATVANDQFGLDPTGMTTSGPQMNAGVRVQAGSGHVVRDSLFANVSSGVEVFSAVSGGGASGQGLTLSANTFGLARDSVTALPVNTSIDMSGPQDVTVSTNTIIGAGSNSGISVAGGSDVTIDANNIGRAPDSQIFPGRTAGGILVSGATTAVSALTITNNNIDGGSGNGITLQGGSSGHGIGGVISGNVLVNNHGAGIRASGDVTGVLDLASYNDFVGNDGLPIDTGATPGVNPSPNGPPAITSAYSGSQQVGITYDGPSGPTSALVWLADVSPGCGPGSGYATSIADYVPLDAQGNFSGPVSLSTPLSVGQSIAVLVTPQGAGISTEFSNCFAVSTSANHQPSAEPGEAAVGESGAAWGTSDMVTLIGTDPDADALTFAPDALSGPNHGTLSDPASVSCDTPALTCTQDWTYTPTPGFVGDDSFTFTVDDGHATSAAATFTIHVTPVLSVTWTGDGSGRVANTELTLNCVGGPLGSGLPSNCAALSPAGTTTTLTATPEPGSTFMGWAGSCQSGGPANECTLTFDHSQAVIANFAQLPATHTLTVVPAGTGIGQVVSGEPAPLIDCGTTCSTTQLAGTHVVLTATAGTSSRFAGWTGACATGTPTNVCDVTLDAEQTVHATFTATSHVTITKAGNGDGKVVTTTGLFGSGCDVGQTSCDAIFDVGQQITLAAVAAPDSTFAGWHLTTVNPMNCSGLGLCNLLILNTDTTLTATFVKTTHTLTVVPNGTGTGTVTDTAGGAGAINCGPTCQADYGSSSTVTLQAVPDAGSRLVGWSDPNCQHPGDTTCTVTMDQAKTVTVTFDLIPYQLTVATAGAGTGTVISTPSGINCGTTCSSSFNYGTSVTLTPYAGSGSTFAGWSGDCSGTGACNVSMTQAGNVTATFNQVLYPLTVTKAGTGTGTVTDTAGGAGAINCGPTCQADYGSSSTVTLRAVPDAGSRLVGWSDPNCQHPGDTTCTVTMDQAKTVTVTFDQVPVGGADLAITGLTDTPDPVTQGADVSYVATVTNTGPSAASGTTFTLGNNALNGLPTGTSFVSGSVTSSTGGSGTCTRTGTGPVVCALTGNAVPSTWTVTVNLATSTTTPSSLLVSTSVTSATSDPNSANNTRSATTTVNPADPNNATGYLPPSGTDQTLATSQTLNVGGLLVLATTPTAPTAAGLTAPPGGPGGSAAIHIVACQVPFICGATPAPRLVTPATTSTKPPAQSTAINNAVVQLVPPSSSYYNYKHPFVYTLAYDKTSVAGLNPLTFKVYYLKDTSTTLSTASFCPLLLRSTTKFPCILSIRYIKSSNPLINGDLSVRLLATYNDPKLATGGHG